MRSAKRSVTETGTYSKQSIVLMPDFNNVGYTTSHTLQWQLCICQKEQRDLGAHKNNHRCCLLCPSLQEMRGAQLRKISGHSQAMAKSIKPRSFFGVQSICYIKASDAHTKTFLEECVVFNRLRSRRTKWETFLFLEVDLIVCFRATPEYRGRFLHGIEKYTK